MQGKHASFGVVMVDNYKCEHLAFSKFQNKLTKVSVSLVSRLVSFFVFVWPAGIKVDCTRLKKMCSLSMQ